MKKAYKLCKEQIRLKHILSKVCYDHKLNKKISSLHVGDIVLVKNLFKPVNTIDNRWCDDNYEGVDHPDDNVAPIFSGVVDMDPPLSPGGRRTYDLCGTCKRTMDNEVPGIMY